MGLFRRRRGRHDMGTPARVVVLASPPQPTGSPIVAAPAAAAAPATAPAVALPPAPASAPAPALPDLPAYEPWYAPPNAEGDPAAGLAPRVELGFRDGSTAQLAPDSAQARALGELAAVLTRKD